MLDWEIVEYMKAMSDKYRGEDGCEKVYLSNGEWMYVEDVCNGVCEFVEKCGEK